MLRDACHEADASAITIDAPPDDVWRVIEPIERHVDWMADAESITFTSAIAARRRARSFDCVTRIGPFRTTDRMTRHRVGARPRRWASSTTAS